MLDFFYKISDTYVFLFMIVITTTFSLLLIFLNKYFIFYKLRYKDNTVTASVGSLIGIIYGVLIGFIWLYLINVNDHASAAALHEGTAAANVYRDSKWLNQPQQRLIQDKLSAYINNVTTIEWPAMSDGQRPHDGNGYIINDMSDILKTYKIITPADNIIVTDLLQELKTLLNARQDRILVSQQGLSSNIWVVILLGTILIIVINYAFRVNFYLHIFSITAFSIMAASVLFLLITLDRPFQGEFVVQPDALQAVQAMMKHDGK